jgi:hypothetical protein
VSQEALVSMLVGTAISIAATWLFAYLYNKRAGEDLRREAEKLRDETGQARRLVNTLAQSLEIAGAIDVTWKDGQLAGVRVPVRAIESSNQVPTPTLTVEPPPR